MGSVFLLAVLNLPAALGQDAEPADEPLAAQSEPRQPDTLADRQEIIRDRVRRLEDRMFQLAKALERTEPENAARLRETLGATRGMAVRSKMEEIIARLKDGRLADAVEDQKDVAADLQELLKILLEDPNRIAERKEEIERLQQLREQLEQVVKEQRAEKADAETAIAAEKLARELEQAAEKIRGLLDQQRQLAAGVQAGSPPNGDKAAEAQEAVRKETDATAEQLDELSKPKEGAADGAGDSKDGGSCQGAANASKELKKASGNMRAAEDGLRQGQKQDAGQKQQAAEKDLQRALQELEKEAKELRNTLRLDDQAKAQQATAEKTKKLGERMKEDAANKDGGESGKPGESPGEGEESSSPGQQDVEGAVPFQEDAARDLDADDPEKAAGKQEEALKRLEQAQEELEDVLEQLRREQQEEMLAALEARFRGMLVQQLECNKAVTRLGELGRENWKRSDQLELVELSGKQRWVGDEADQALAILVDEGTTVVFPEIVEQVRDDARDVADRLSAADTGPGVRQTQEEIVLALQDLIDAVKRMQEENQQNAGGGGGGGGNNPLLPGSAELKLLRSCQLRVNSATERLEAERSSSEAPFGIDARLVKLAKRQADVAEMARQMHEAMTKAQ